MEVAEEVRGHNCEAQTAKASMDGHRGKESSIRSTYICHKTWLEGQGDGCG